MSNIHILQLSSYTQPSIVESPRNEWVEYGDDNNYYNWLIDRFRNSATHNAVVNNVARLIYGKGLDAKDSNRKPNEYAQMKMLFGKDCLRAVTLDYKLLGSGAFQLIYSKDRKTISKVEHLPMNLLRPSKCDENGDINGYWYSDNWEDTKKFPPMYIPLFGTSTENIECLVFGNYSVGRKYFHSVDYEGALDYAVLEEEIATYLINDCKNGFSPTTIINYNNGTPTEEQQRLIANKTINKTTGTNGAKTIISFNDDETKKTTIDSVPLNDAPAHYEYLSTEARNKILVGHNVTSPMLVGVTLDGSGFSSSADEIEVAAKYFYNTVIMPFQEVIIDAIDKVLAFNQVSLDLFFKRLNLLEDFESQAQAEEVEMSKQSSLDDDIFNALDVFADDDLEGWELVDSQKVDYELESDLDNYIDELNAPTKSLLSKVWEFVSTGTARANAKSEQDGNVFKTRYRYSGQLSADSRAFCKKMIQANKVYRKEDILNMESQVVNEGWGPKGADTYSIWLYKGGGACHHFWTRETYLKKSDANSPLARKYTPSEVRKAGEIVPLTDKDKKGKARNDKRVYTAPKDMPYEGFLPTNKRFN